MIHIDGEYVFDIEVGSFKDFIESRDLVEFTIIEEAGNTLPSFDLKFRFSIPELRNYLIENNVLRVTIGSSEDEKVSIPLRIFKKDLQNYGQSRFYVEISGFYDALGYMKGSHTVALTSDSGEAVSGLQAIKQTVSKFFNFDTNISTDDIGSQKWLCCRKSYRDFVTDIWYRMGLPDKSVPMTTITKNGFFRLIDSNVLAKTSPKYRLSNRPATNPNDIQINGKPEIVNDAGAVNGMIQNRVNRVYDMVQGAYREIKFSTSPILSTTYDLDASSIDRKDGYDFYTNNNVSSNYWDNYLHNVSSLIHLSTARLTVSFIGKYVEDLHALDLVEYLEGTENNLNVTEGLYSGKYLVSKVVRTIGEDKNFQTHLVLTRESFNELIDYTREVSNVATEILEDGNYSQAIVKINSVMDNIRNLFSSKSIKLNLASVRLLAQELESITSSLYGYDDSGIWLKTEHILSSSENSLISDVLESMFNYLATRGETVYLAETDPIIVELNSGMYSSYIERGYLSIPNIGSTSTVASDYTASCFSWYIQDKLTQDVETGNSDLNNLLRETLNFVTTEGIIGQQDSEVFRRFWGSSDDANINEDELKQLYSDESVRKSLHKIFIPRGYMYIAYPVYAELGEIRIDGNNYRIYGQDEIVIDKNSFKVNTKRIKIGNIYQDYLIYRSNFKFSSRVILEVL